MLLRRLHLHLHLHLHPSLMQRQLLNLRQPRPCRRSRPRPLRRLRPPLAAA